MNSKRFQISTSWTWKFPKNTLAPIWWDVADGLGVPLVGVHDDVIKWKQCYWPFVRGIHRSPVNSPHKGQWRRALMFSLICARINGWINKCGAGDLRRHRVHYDVTIMRRRADNRPIPWISQFHIPQYTIQKRNVHISALNGALWDMRQCIVGLVRLVDSGLRVFSHWIHGTKVFFIYETPKENCYFLWFVFIILHHVI